MNNKVILDCESLSSALQSLATMFKCASDTLQAFLSIPEIDTYYEENLHHTMSFREYLYEVTVKNIGEPQILDAVCWFHTTRIRQGTSFAEGILPLGAILPNLTKMLIDVLDDPVRGQFRTAIEEKGIGDIHYSTKTNNEMHWGPYAILVRDVAFEADRLGQHDYLGMPEIIEDICHGISESGGPDFLSDFFDKLEPAIVKFVSDKFLDEALVATALCYIRSRILQRELDTCSVHCFNGENEPVDPRDIISIDYVENLLTHRKNMATNVEINKKI